MSSAANSDRNASPWTSRRFVIAAAVVAAIVLMGLVVLISNLWGGDPAQESAPGPSQTPAGTAEASSGPAGASMCGLSATADAGTVTRPPAAQWTLVGTTAAPQSPTFGPGMVEPTGYRHCYARTPEGAVFAAANFVAMGSQPSLMPDIARGSVVPGSGRDVLLAQSPRARASGGVRVQIAGVRVLEYLGNRATVDVALRTSSGALGGQVFDLLWDGGDWKMEVTSTGDLLTRASQTKDLAGYIPWAGA